MRGLSLALIAVLGLTGCIVHHNTETGWPGDIVFYWSFPNSQTCSQVPGAPFIHVTLTGTRGTEVLPQEGWYNCRSAGTDGVVLTDFNPGSYTYTVDAYDSNQSKILYTTTGTLRVDGDITVNVTLNPTVVTGEMQLYWKFWKPDNSFNYTEVACASAGIAKNQAGSATPGVTKIKVGIDNEPVQVISCSTGVVQGASWELNPGSHQVTLEGVVVRDSVEEVWYGQTQTVTVVSGQSKDATFDMYPVAAGATFFPKVKYGSATYNSCESSSGGQSITTFSIVLTDWENNSTTLFVAPWSDCDTYISKGFFYPYLRAAQPGHYVSPSGAYQGTWKVEIKAWPTSDGTGTVLFKGAPDVLITAGLPDQNADITMTP
jgi:hypothetical protein